MLSLYPVAISTRPSERNCSPGRMRGVDILPVGAQVPFTGLYNSAVGAIRNPGLVSAGNEDLRIV